MISIFHYILVYYQLIALHPRVPCLIANAFICNYYLVACPWAIIISSIICSYLSTNYSSLVLIFLDFCETYCIRTFFFNFYTNNIFDVVLFMKFTNTRNKNSKSFMYLSINWVIHVYRTLLCKNIYRLKV